MDEFVYIGKIVNTHGIKGELRIISDFDRKDLVFIPGINFYLGRKKECFKVNTYRKHKNFDMVTFCGFDDINQVLRFKKLWVYVKRCDLNLKDSYLDSDLINFSVYDKDINIGNVVDIVKNGSNKLLKVKNSEKYFYIPFRSEFIKNIDLNLKKIDTELIEGMI